MTPEALAAALEREHREIDDGVEAFLAASEKGRSDTDPLIRAIGGLRRHIYLEEELLFPPLREAGMAPPIFVMLREHGEIWDTMDRLEAELEADPTGLTVQSTCHELLERLERHNAKEEPIVYPQTEVVLADAALGRLRRFLGAGELPPGWVCEMASG